MAQGVVTSQTMISDGTDVWFPSGKYVTMLGMFKNASAENPEAKS